jgi:hypothetical protein
VICVTLSAMEHPSFHPPALPARGVAFGALLGVALWLVVLGLSGALLGLVP